MDRESAFLRRYLSDLIASGKRMLLLDLTNLSQVDSSGISVIVRTCVALKAQGGELKLLCPRGPVMEVLAVLHLPDIIPSFEDEAQALASFQPRGHSATLRG